MVQITKKDIRCLPSRKTIRMLQVRFEELDALRQTYLAKGDAMVARFKSDFPDSPAYLVRYSDRTNNDYRWRMSSARRWRGDRPAKINRSFDLTSETGQILLAEQVPADMRRTWLEFENERVSLNFEVSRVNHERYRVRDLIKQKETLRQLLRKPADNRA